ncbi:MAG TPA: YlxR family protein [Trueperaceae bacterium]|nr:YlxR family protein [Trueperaceae bacterium]
MSKVIRHVPLRRCVVCRDSFPQAELLRLTAGQDGTYQFDGQRRLGGRGTWVCRGCASDAVANDNEKVLRRAFRAQAPQVLELLRRAATRPAGPTPGPRRPSTATARQDGGMDVR